MSHPTNSASVALPEVSRFVDLSTLAGLKAKYGDAAGQQPATPSARPTVNGSSMLANLPHVQFGAGTQQPANETAQADPTPCAAELEPVDEATAQGATKATEPQPQSAAPMLRGARVYYKDGTRNRSCELFPASYDVLQRMASEWGYLAEGGGFMIRFRDGEKKQPTTFGVFATAVYGELAVRVRPGAGSDDDGIRTVPAVDVFTANPGVLMRAFDRVTLTPTENPPDEHSVVLNLWHHWAQDIVKPDMSATDDDVRWYTDIVLNVVCSGDRVPFEHHLNRLALCLQKPWVRCNSFDYLVGVGGSGKTLVAHETRKALFGGQLTTLCTGSDLASKFDDILASAFVVTFDELTRKQGREVIEKLRGLTTSGDGTLEKKSIAARKISDRVLNISVCTNHEDAMILDEDDRRANVMLSSRRLTTEERRTFLANLKNPESAAKLAGWLVKRDLSNFDPGAPVPVSRSKRAIAAACLGDVYDQVADMIERRLCPFNHDMVSLTVAARDVRRVLEIRDPLSAQKLRKMLSTFAGRELENKAVRVHRPGSDAATNEKLCVFRNVDEWKSATPEQRGKHLGSGGYGAEIYRPFTEKNAELVGEE